MTIPLNFQGILTCLTQLKRSSAIEPRNQQIYVSFQVNGQEVPVFFGIRSDTLLQLIAYFPFHASDKNSLQIGRLLHMLNRDVDLPGFGMDEKAGLVFYRSVILCLEQKMDPQVVEFYLKITQVIVETFMASISQIAQGAKNIDDLLKG